MSTWMFKAQKSTCLTHHSTISAAQRSAGVAPLYNKYQTTTYMKIIKS